VFALSAAFAFGPVHAQLTPVAITPPHLGNADAGTLPGGFSVGPDGSASYSVPIDVPPGTAGMSPKLSLSYSSQSSSGLMGVGWGLSGLSTIHRCSKTLAQDATSGRISFDNADRLCLDGQRLLLATAGANPADDNAYWAAAAQYRTERESFTRITRQSGGGFKVEAKDGLVQYFGINTARVKVVVASFMRPSAA